MRRALLLLALGAAGCGGPDRAAPGGDDPARAGERPGRIVLHDATSAAGIRFRHFNDASPRRLLPETMGAGCALLDYDGDGLTDVYLVNGAPLAGDRGGAPTGALYRNRGGWRFEDVTAAAGLDRPIYGMGAAVGDYDNDGLTDLVVTGVGEDRLYRNVDGRRFEDVSAAVGLDDPGFSSSAAFLDYDRDGWLDLLIARYVTWEAASDLACSPDGRHRIYCTPERYPGAASRLYRNLEGQRLADVTRASGLWRSDGKTLGVAVIDHTGDGWPDLLLANDTVRNFLFANQGDGSFREVGVEARIAYSESGAPRGGMGVDAADADGDGHVDVLIGNFSQEMAAFFRGSAGGYFLDEAAQAGLGLPTLLTLAFGALLRDLDGDGRPDVMLANGHIEPEIGALRQGQSYAQPLQLFRNAGGARFELVAPRGDGDPLGGAYVGRGLCAGDLDADGDLDLLLTQNGREAVLLRNDSPPRAWIRILPEGRRSSRSGYGLTARAVTDAGLVEATLRSGGSYLAASEPVLTLGLGDATRVERLELRWPSGVEQVLPAPALRETLRVVEPDPP